MVAEPSAEYGARNGSELIGEIRPSGALEVHAVLGEDGRGPVQAAIADHVYEGIRHGNVPEQFIAQHGFEYLLRRNGLLVLLVVTGRMVAAPFLYGGQPAALRSVTDEAISYDGDEYGHRGGEQEGSGKEIILLVGAVQPASEPYGSIGRHRPDQGSAHIMGTVPYAHPRTPFLYGEAAGHHPSARRPAHTVEPADQGVQHTHHKNCKTLVLSAYELDGDNHEAHRNGCQNQAHRQEHAGVRTVGHAAVQELRQGVCGGIQTQHETELSLLEAERHHGRDSH